METVKAVLEFLFITVGLKMVIGHWLAQKATDFCAAFFARHERNFAIWSHYQLKASGDGHGSSIYDCGQGKCGRL